MNDIELAQWLEETQRRNDVDAFIANPHGSSSDAWLLTARQLQKKHMVEMEDYATWKLNAVLYAEPRLDNFKGTIEEFIEILKLHFLKGEDNV